VGDKFAEIALKIHYGDEEKETLKEQARLRKKRI